MPCNVYLPMASSGKTSQSNCTDPHRQHIGLRLAQPFCKAIARLGRMPSPNVGGGYPSGCAAFENRLWGIGKRRILTMTQLMTHSDTTQSLGFLSIDRLDWVTVATRKPDVDTLEANPGPECRYGEKRASPSTKIMQASKEMPQKILCTTAKYSLCI